MIQTARLDVQLMLAREVADKTRRNFYGVINEGFTRAVTNALNEAGYVLHIKLGVPSFEKDISSAMVAVRSDNIYKATPLAILLAAQRAIAHLPRLKAQGVSFHVHSTF